MTDVMKQMAVAVAAVALLAMQRIPTPGTVVVQLLAINDFHGNLEPPNGGDGRVNAIPAGGAEYLATHLARARAENPRSIVVSAGDVVGASPLLSSVFHDEATIETMNAMQLSVSSVGNHEFDEGPLELLRMKRGTCHPVDGCSPVGRFRGARFDYLSANVVRSDTRATLFPPVTVRKIGGVKIGFIGETLQGTPQVVSASAIKGLTFLDEASTANAYAEQLKRQGVHAIVLLIHQGGRQAPAGDLDPNGCERFTGGIEPVLQTLSADIPVVISGHSHEVYNCRINGHLVTNAGSYGRGVTRITLEINRASGRIVNASAINETVSRDVPRDPAVTTILDRYRALVDARAGRVAGSISADIVRRANEAGESPLGDIVADAQLAATRSLPDGGAVVAFTNFGGLRSDLVSNPQGSAKPGDVTFGDLFAVQPFGNVVTLMTITGETLVRLLEQQFDNPRPGARRMLQVSDGLTYRYRATATAGQHIDPESIRVQGRRIGTTDRLRVAASEFLIGGGDRFTAFGDADDIVGVTADVDAFAAYLREHSPVAPGPQNRIERID